MKKNGTCDLLMPGRLLERCRKIVFFTFFLFFLTFPMLASAYAQLRKVSFEVQNVNLAEIIAILEKSTNYTFLYQDEQVERVKNLTFHFVDEELCVVLEKCLEGTNLTYHVEDETIILRVRELKPETVQPRVQERKLTGRVTDESGTSLPGVTVVIEGTTVGTVTDVDGNYALNCPEQEGLTLVFSFVGMETQQITVGERNEVNVTMKAEIAEIDEVVVNGYFTRKTEGFAGAVTTIKKEDLQKVHTANIFTTLSALDAGFKITENNVMGSNPNTLPEFTIRGKGSFQEGSSAPLFILDGFETTIQKVYDMDVNRIESITILKDASATILYGSRAANGVVVIETVKPKPGQLRVTYDFKPAVDIADLTDYDLMNAAEKLEYERLAGLYDPIEGDLSTTYEREARYYEKYKNVQEGVNTDWLAQPVRNAFSHTHSLLVEGGANNVLYSIDGFFDRNRGVMKGSGRDRYGLGFTLQYRIKDKIIIRNYASYSNTHAYDSPYGSFSTYAAANPYERPWFDNGELRPTLLNGSANPLYDASLPNRSLNDNEAFSDNLNIDWIAGNGWRLIGSLRIEKGNIQGETYRSPLSSDFLVEKRPENEYVDEVTYEQVPLEQRGELSLSSGKYLNYTGKLTVNYNKQFGEKHLLFFGAGAEINQNRTSTYSFTATGFADDRYSDPAFAIQFMEDSRPGSSESTTRSIGLLANVNYIFDDRFFLDLSGRYDGSSLFGADKRWAPFWSIGGGWNIHKEHFWSSDNMLDLLKIRMSYGITGNQEFQAYQAQTMYQYQTGRLYNTLVPATLMGYGNENLKWQNQYTTNVGVDLGMWKNRLSFMFNYYYKKTDGMLAKITVAPSLGIPSNNFTSNLGEIENKGWEITLSGSPLRIPEADLEWRLSFQISQNRNKLNEISNELKNLNARNNMEMEIPGNVYEEGESMTAIKAVPSLGIDPGTGQEIYVKKDGSLTMEWDAADKILCGDTEPDVFGNISTNLYWKGFNLNAVFQYSIGGDVYNQTLASRVEGVNPSGNADRRVLHDRWTTPGQSALYRNIRDYGQTYVSTRFVQCDNYLDLKSLSLSYDLKKEWIRRFGLESVRVSFYMNDLFHASTVKQERGTSYPFARSFSFGLNIGI